MRQMPVGEQFQTVTRHRRSGSFANPDWGNEPEIYKTYPHEQKISLLAPKKHGGPGIWQVVGGRRSERSFTGKRMNAANLSQVLWASQGITDQMGGYDLRAAPSAGALYPVETYVVVNLIEDIDSGVYHYSVRDHSLEQLRIGDFRLAISRAALDQMFCAQANVVLIWTAVFQRSRWKYGQRAYRYIYLDAGHIGHAVAMAATSLGLGSCPIAAFYDDEVDDLIKVDGREESAIYMTALGQIK